MSQDLSQDEVNELASLLAISQKAKARESLCIKIGITYYNELGFIYESSEDSFATNLVNYLNQVENTKAICHLCCQELMPVFQTGKRESFLKGIAAKLDCNPDLRRNYSSPGIVEQPTPTPSPVPELGINPPLQPNGSKSQSRGLVWWVTGGAISLVALVLAGIQILNTGTVDPRYTTLDRLLSEGKWEDADRETANRMWEVAGSPRLKVEDYKKFPCEDLKSMDNLWTKYSKQHFGFSIQSHIWQSSDVNSDFGKFIRHVGWAMVGNNGQTAYYPITNFSLIAPSGALPWYITWVGGNTNTRVAYMSRILSCGVGGP